MGIEEAAAAMAEEVAQVTLRYDTLVRASSLGGLLVRNCK